MRKASDDTKSSADADVLRNAARFGDEDEVTEILKRAKHAGCLAEIVSAADTLSGNRPLHLCGANGHLLIIRDLLDAGADINAVNHAGSTALHYSAVAGQESCVKMLLQAGADPFIQNQSLFTALDEAQKAQRKDIVALLMRWAEKIASTSEGPSLPNQGDDDNDDNGKHYVE